MVGMRRLNRKLERKWIFVLCRVEIFYKYLVTWKLECVPKIFGFVPRGLETK